MKLVLGLLGLLVGAVVGLFGLFLILYRGEDRSEGDTYVNLGGNKIDADFVGIPLLAIGLIIVIASLLRLRRSGVP
jgi:ABC-type antimicrobial peptide transport system permease subunit